MSTTPNPNSLWERCMLEGADLDSAVATILGVKHQIVKTIGGTELVPVCTEFLKDPYDVRIGPYQPSTNWVIAGPLIEKEQIYLVPPHSMHVCGGPTPGWHTIRVWRATVSNRIEERGTLNERKIFGRGSGPTSLIAAMRAIVDSRS